MRKLLFISFALFTLILACKPPRREVSPFLTIIEDESGDSIKIDDFLSIRYTEKTQEGKLVSSTSDFDDRPRLMFREARYFKGDFFDMLGHLTEGDSAEFKISVDSLIKKKGVQLKVPTKGKYLIYNVRIVKVVGRGKLDDSSYNASIEGYRKESIEKEKSREQSKIDAYISRNNITPSKTNSGLYYVVSKAGSGNKANPKDTLVVNYIGRTTTGKIFETTFENVAKTSGTYNARIAYQPIKVPLASGPPVSGFMEAMTMFPKGTKATLVIPSKLAYADGNYKMLEPYTPLVCELEIVDIIRAKK